MSLSEAELEILNSEEGLLEKIIENLEDQVRVLSNRRASQSTLARQLTSEIVAATRAEDKIQTMSDEAVAHGMVKKALEEIKTIEEQQKEPYFARLELLEDGRKIEYKLGKAANPDCRIIDWRKAPIAKLYYEYNEGDIYDEVILERERSGEVTLKNSYVIEDGEMKSLTCRHGSFQKEQGQWQKGSSDSKPRESYSELPDILALITAKQYESITLDSESPVLIQGVAGSGKTAVALHRLAWLLHEDNSGLKEEDIFITLKSPALYKYIQNSLEKLGVKVKLALWEDIQELPSFKHLIIDEVQDFGVAELDKIFSVHKRPNRSTILGDVNQNLNIDSSFPGWGYLKNKIGIDTQTDVIELNVSHRSSLQIMRLAQHFSGSGERTDLGKAGKTPVWFNCKNEDSALKATSEWLKIAQDKYPNSLSAVLCPDARSARELFNLLEPKFSFAIRPAERDFNFSAGIVVGSIKEVKGLEFFNVLLWDVSAKSFPEGDLNRKKLYVGCTRAEGNLALVNFGKPTPLLNGISGKDLRKYSYTIE